MAENITKIILNGTEYAIQDNVTQYHTINGQTITGGTGDITITGDYALKSNSEEITFTLEDGSTVKKKFVLG